MFRMRWYVVYYMLIAAVDTAVSVVTGGDLAAVLVAGFGVVLGATWGRLR